MEIIHKVENIGIGNRLYCPIGEHNLILVKMKQAHLNLFDIRGQQRQSRQGSRTNRKPFTSCGSRIAQCIQRISPFTHLGIQTTHLGITASIVGYRPIGIRGQRNTQRREHTDSGNTNTIQPLTQRCSGQHILEIETNRTQVGQNNRCRNGQHRHRRRNHPHTDTGDNHRSRTSLGAFGNAPGRFVRV